MAEGVVDLFKMIDVRKIIKLCLNPIRHLKLTNMKTLLISVADARAAQTVPGHRARML